MADTLRVGVIGAGGNTRARHIPGLLEQDNVEIAAICNRTADSARKAADACGLSADKIKCFGEDAVGEIFSDNATDAVVIGTWPYKHCEHVLAALAAGKHVMTEARMAMNAEEGERMLAASREKPDLVTQIVPSPFTLPVDALTRHLVHNEIGELKAVEVRHFLAGDAREPATLSWRHLRKFSGNNIMSLGILYEALMRWAGPASRIGSAQAATLVHLRFDKEKMRKVSVDIPDHLTVTATLAKGDVPVSFTLTSTRSSTENGFWLYGTEGRVRVMLDGKVWHKPVGESAWKRRQPGEHASPGWRVEEEFVGAIRGEEGIKLTTFEDGVRYMRFTDAVVEAAAANEPRPISNDV